MALDENPLCSQSRDIVVIGGSGGSLEALRTTVGGLPPDFPGSIFVIIHVSASSPALMDEYVAQCGPLPASQPRDQEVIRREHIYVARADYHLTLEPGKIRVQRGPRENRHRPAIDPLFRTAARVYGPRAIGIVLSGLNDDGSAGLFAIKQRGGIAIVQDPKDATFGTMPRRALEHSGPHYILPASEIAPNLVQLVHADGNKTVMPNKNSQRNSRTASSKTSGPLPPTNRTRTLRLPTSMKEKEYLRYSLAPNATAYSGNYKMGIS